MAAWRDLGRGLAAAATLGSAALLGWAVLNPPPALPPAAPLQAADTAGLIAALTAGDRGALVEDLRGIAALLQGPGMPMAAGVA
ncbi:hypothetical protein, partial [Falsiroseomonas selenitidurans]